MNFYHLSTKKYWTEHKTQLEFRHSWKVDSHPGNSDQRRFSWTRTVAKRFTIKWHSWNLTKLINSSIMSSCSNSLFPLSLLNTFLHYSFQKCNVLITECLFLHFSSCLINFSACHHLLLIDRSPLSLLHSQDSHLQLSSHCKNCYKVTIESICYIFITTATE